MRRLLFAVAAMAALSACGSKYDQNGDCAQDSDCQLCTVCTCARAYANADLNGATCDKVAGDESCPATPPSGCLGGGSYRALCVSGRCAVVNR